MTPYTQHKVKELTEFMKALSQRQRNILRELRGNYNHEYKNLLHNEHVTNSAVLRCAEWIRMTLKGKSLKDKLLVDKEFPLWYIQTYGYYVYKPLARLWNWPEEKYVSPCRTWSWNHAYFSQRQLFYYVYDMLFPDKAPGVFGFQSDDDIECDIWRTTFRELDKKEWKEFKEITKL